MSATRCAACRALGFRGANVTIPHKGAVAALIDWLERDAALAEAVNTIVVEDDGTLRGYNTDIAGFLRALEETLTVAASRPARGGAPALGPGAGADPRRGRRGARGGSRPRAPRRSRSRS